MKGLIKIFLVLSIGLLLFKNEKGVAQMEAFDVPFKNGEKLEYRVHYGLINAGEATISIDDKFHVINNSQCYRVNVYGRTTGAFDWVLSVRDTWVSFIDKNTLTPEKFYRNIQEGNYYTEETTIFHKDRRIASVTERKRDGYKKQNQEYNINKYTQDLVSGFYYIRSLNFNKMSPGDLIPINAFFEDSTYYAEIKYLGTEVLKTKFGKKNTHVFTPIVPNNELFQHGENTILVYFSDDKNKIPVKIKANLFIGAVECDLKSYKGLNERL